MDLASLNTAIARIREIDDLRPKVYAHPDDYDSVLGHLPEDVLSRVRVLESRMVTAGHVFVVSPEDF